MLIRVSFPFFSRPHSSPLQPEFHSRSEPANRNIGFYYFSSPVDVAGIDSDGHQRTDMYVIRVEFWCGRITEKIRYPVDREEGNW